MRLEAFGRSEKGLHLRNQDSFLIGKGVFAVADGVTVAKNSERASRAAVDFFGKAGRDMEKGFSEINRRICGMGNGKTTLTVAKIENYELTVGHVGDSCLLLVRGSVRKITEDDSLAGSNVLTQCLGQKGIVPHFYRVGLKKGDIILLATDGVSNHVGEEEILQILKNRELRHVPGALISIAKEKRKLYEDDKTVVVIKVL